MWLRSLRAASARSPAAFRRELRAENRATCGDAPRGGQRSPTFLMVSRAPLCHRSSIFSPAWPSFASLSALSPFLASVARILVACQSGRGGGIRTPTLGFGDRWSTVEPTPLYPEREALSPAKGLPGPDRPAQVFPP